MNYLPGKHVIATLQTTDINSIISYSAYKNLLDTLIVQHNLQKLGEVYHNFSPAGFTAVICLSESHISIHTWPEFGKINLDIYLSNYQRNNEGTVDALYNAFVTFFNGTVTDIQTITR